MSPPERQPMTAGTNVAVETGSRVVTGEYRAGEAQLRRETKTQRMPGSSNRVSVRIGKRAPRPTQVSIDGGDRCSAAGPCRRFYLMQIKRICCKPPIRC